MLYHEVHKSLGKRIRQLRAPSLLDSSGLVSLLLPAPRQAGRACYALCILYSYSLMCALLRGRLGLLFFVWGGRCARVHTRRLFFWDVSIRNSLRSNKKTHDIFIMAQQGFVYATKKGNGKTFQGYAKSGILGVLI